MRTIEARTPEGIEWQVRVLWQPRVLLRRPWTVEAITRRADGSELRVTTNVVGWRHALRTRDEIAQRLRAGQDHAHSRV